MASETQITSIRVLIPPPSPALDVSPARSSVSTPNYVYMHTQHDTHRAHAYSSKFNSLPDLEMGPYLNN